MTNYYAILGLNHQGENVTSLEVKKAYAHLALKRNPYKLPVDRDDDANDPFHDINEAYDTLMNELEVSIDDDEKETIIRVYKDIINRIC